LTATHFVLEATNTVLVDSNTLCVGSPWKAPARKPHSGKPLQEAPEEETFSN